MGTIGRWRSSGLAQALPNASAGYFEPGGVIGRHEAGVGQIFLALAGSGWVAGGDDQRIALAEGEAAFICRGEVHSKGSERGMTAFMLQVRDLTLPGRQQ